MTSPTMVDGKEAEEAATSTTTAQIVAKASAQLLCSVLSQRYYDARESLTNELHALFIRMFSHAFRACPDVVGVYWQQLEETRGGDPNCCEPHLVFEITELTVIFNQTVFDSLRSRNRVPKSTSPRFDFRKGGACVLYQAKHLEDVPIGKNKAFDKVRESYLEQTWYLQKIFDWIHWDCLRDMFFVNKAVVLSRRGDLVTHVIK